MRMVTLFKRQVYRLAAARRFGWRWATRLANLDIWPLPDAQVDSNGLLRLEGVDQPLDLTSMASEVLLRTHLASGELGKRMGATFKFNGSELNVQVNGVLATARNVADLLLFHEIFVEQPYQFHLPGRLLILDLGCNIGLASLYLAKMQDAIVHAYELVPSTAEIAAENFALNPHLSVRIALFSSGISSSSGEFEIETDAAVRTSNSLDPPTNLTATKRMEKVKVLDVDKVMKRALHGQDDRQIVVKMDIEGAEYETMQRLADCGHLEKVSVLIIEWHEREGRDPESIRRHLADAGFVWFERLHVGAPVGMINAFRIPSTG